MTSKSRTVSKTQKSTDMSIGKLHDAVQHTEPGEEGPATGTNSSAPPERLLEAYMKRHEAILTSTHNIQD